MAASNTPIVPRETDVLCGKTRECLVHKGSCEFRYLIESYCERYKRAEDKYSKMALTREIYSKVSQTARFLRLKQSDGTWEELSPAVARDKVGHALRFSALRRNKKRGRPAKAKPTPTEAPTKQQVPSKDIVPLMRWPGGKEEQDVAQEKKKEKHGVLPITTDFILANLQSPAGDLQDAYAAKLKTTTLQTHNLCMLNYSRTDDAKNPEIRPPDVFAQFCSENVFEAQKQVQQPSFPTIWHSAPNGVNSHTMPAQVGSSSSRMNAGQPTAQMNHGIPSTILVQSFGKGEGAIGPGTVSPIPQESCSWSDALSQKIGGAIGISPFAKQEDFHAVAAGDSSWMDEVFD